MRSAEEAELKARELNHHRPVGAKVFYAIDRSMETGAWRVIEFPDGYYRKVVAS